MVIPSDITRWGFVQVENSESAFAADTKPMMNFIYENWLMGISGHSYKDGAKACIIYFKGRPKRKDSLLGPNDVYGFLKKVGYLIEK